MFHIPPRSGPNLCAWYNRMHAYNPPTSTCLRLWPRMDVAQQSRSHYHGFIDSKVSSWQDKCIYSSMSNSYGNIRDGVGVTVTPKVGLIRRKRYLFTGPREFCNSRIAKILPLRYISGSTPACPMFYDPVVVSPNQIPENSSRTNTVLCRSVSIIKRQREATFRDDKLFAAPNRYWNNRNRKWEKTDQRTQRKQNRALQRKRNNLTKTETRVYKQTQNGHRNISGTCTSLRTHV